MLPDGYGVGCWIYPHYMRQLIWSIADGTHSDRFAPTKTFLGSAFSILRIFWQRSEFERSEPIFVRHNTHPGCTTQTESDGQPLLPQSPQIGMDSPVGLRDSFEDQGQKLKACEENLRRYHQLALAGRLVGATMHEVNNRLAALTNLIFLARTLPERSVQGIEYLDEADSQLRSLGEITSRSLSFIRLDTEAKEIDLIDLATSALRLHHEQISKKKINVQTRSSESALARVKKGEIFQVITNLLHNSIEALSHSGMLHVRVAIRRSNAIITIADNGAGIPKSMRGTLFDAFKSDKSQGNGLGLWIVREIVHGHGGTIQYRSSSVVGRSGTIFRVSLPTQSLARTPSPEGSYVVDMGRNTRTVVP
jgi:signal transduction histidine kinase